MKKLLFNVVGGVMIGLMGIISVPFTQAANLSIILTATNKTALLTNVVRLNSITIYGPNTNAAMTTLTLFDAPGGSNMHSANALALTFTNQSYTNYSYTLSSITNSYVNIFGFTTNDIFSGLTRVTNTVVATNQQYRIIAGATIISNTIPTPVTLTFGGMQLNTKGLVITNQPLAGALINIDYEDKN